MISSFKDLVDLASVVQSLAAVIAIIVGGIWSYLLFIQRREKFPCLSVEHFVHSLPVVAGIRLVSVDIILTNSSKVLLKMERWQMRLNQMMPPSTELARILVQAEQIPTGRARRILDYQVLDEQNPLSEMEIEPGEKQQLHFDYMIDPSVQVVQIWSCFQNKRKQGKRMVWETTTSHLLGNE